MAAQFQFVMRSGPTVGKSFPLEGAEISIGRDASNMVTINDPEVSRRHARMELRGAVYVIQDLGSTNGTFVNGTRVGGMQVLNAGDTVTFGEGIVLAYESTMENVNATVMTAKAPQTAVQRPAPVSAPVPYSAPAPYSAPIPVSAPAPVPVPSPMYSGQVPAGPIPMPSSAAPAKKKFPVWVIVAILLVVVICACVAFFTVIDQLSLWCKVVPFLVPILGGKC